ncbi:MAG: hypothetical protein JWR22_3885 [Herminiimonas sp.]|nr:hypothetical protein [Herminiimonas sp.]
MLTMADAEAIAQLPVISAAAPMQPDTAQLAASGSNWSTGVVGTTPARLEVRDRHVASGLAFTDSDVRSATRVALLGRTVVKNLFGDEDCVGKTIRIRKSPYIVIGVLAGKGQSLNGQDQDDTILIPVTTAQRKLFGSQFPGAVRLLFVQADSAAAMPAAERNMTQLLRKRHPLQDFMDNDFNIRNLTAVFNAAADISRVMTLMLGAIASISLVVGGIGIPLYLTKSFFSFPCEPDHPSRVLRCQYNRPQGHNTRGDNHAGKTCDSGCISRRRRNPLQENEEFGRRSTSIIH